MLKVVHSSKLIVEDLCDRMSHISEFVYQTCKHTESLRFRNNNEIDLKTHSHNLTSDNFQTDIYI